MRYCWLPVLTLAAVICAGSPSAEAQSYHTWVSAEGSDSNAGTRQSPFATFAEAISQTAVGGTVSVVDNGDYGPIQIGNAITIDGGGCRAWTSRSESTGSAVSVNDYSSTGQVVLRNLDIDGTNGIDGISDGSCNALIVENCTIRNCGSDGIAVVPNLPGESVSVSGTDISGCVDGVLVVSAGGSVHLTMRDCVITKASSYGIQMQAGTLDVNSSTISHNHVGIESTASTLNAVGCTISGNTTGIQADSGGRIRISNDAILDNGTGILLNGGTVGSFRNNSTAGNTVPGAPSTSTGQI
jgi:hypothetical protein